MTHCARESRSKARTRIRTAFIPALGASCLGLLGLHTAAQPSIAVQGAADVADPFAYCARVGIDDRLSIEAGDESARVLAPYVRATLGLPLNATAPSGLFWRCMDAKVYICVVGANLPCDSKADRAKRNRGADRYCREYPEATDVPAYATGHQTVYLWHCSAGRAIAARTVVAVDRRGFRTDIWHVVSR